MAESYSVKAILSATDNGFSSTLKNALNTTESLADKIKSGFAFGVLQGVGQQAFSAITNSARDLISEIGASNAAWKTFTANMEMLGKSESEIKGVKKELQEFAEQTVYSSSDMATTFAQLEAVGVKNTTSLVKGFGGLAAAAENPQQAMKTLSTQATQMAAKPSVAWADFKLMLEQTPAGIAAVAKEMGMSTAEMVANVQDGKVSTDEFFKAIEKVGTSKSFTKLATEYKTVGQAMDGLKETVGNKLTPAFDVLSSAGIKAISGIADKLGAIDAEGLADKVSAMVDKATQYWNVLTDAFSGTGGELMEAFNAIKSGLSGVSGAFGEITSIDSFKSACESAAGAIKTVADFLEEHGESIGKALPYVAALVIAFKGFKAVSTYVPGMVSFAKSIATMAAGGISSLAGKLFGIAGGTKAAGEAGATSANQMLAAAKAFMMIGAGVLMIAAGFALLAQSAIALSNAGGLAIGVMFGLVAALAALSIGMMAMMKTITASPAQLAQMSVAMLAVGASILMISIGFALLAQSSIALANAGGAAIGVMAGMIVVIALLAVGAVALGTAAASASYGLIILTAVLTAIAGVIVAIGVSTLLAAAALAIVAAVLPQICQYGLEGAVAILALSAAMIVFSVGASAAGVAALVLGYGMAILAVSLAAVAVAVTVLASGLLVIAVSAMMVAAAITLVANALPLIIQHSNAGSKALAVLSLGLMAFGAGALVAGAGAIVLGAGLAVAAVGIAAVGVAVTVLASGIMLMASACLLAAAALALISVVLPTLTSYGKAGAEAILVLSAAMLVFGAAAGVAGAGCTVLGVGLAVVGAGITVIGVGIATLAAGVLTLSISAMAAAAAIALLALALPGLIKVAAEGSAALLTLSTGLISFAAATTLAGAGCIVLGAGLLVASAGFTTLGGSLLVVAGGMLVLVASLVLVNSSMKSIAKNAKSAESSLDSMQNSVDLVESGLDALGDKAKSAMKKLKNAFDDTADDAKKAGKKVGTGFTDGMKTGLAKAPLAATKSVAQVNTALNAGRASAFMAGAYISQGFASGMLSCLGTIQSAAARIAAAADKAVRAKAKIHSPSKVAAGLGSYWGEGFANGIDDMVKRVWDAAENLVSIPTVKTPDLAMAYGGEMSSDYRYYSESEYTIVVPFSVDGREFASATAKYTQSELDKRQLRESRKHGKV